MVRRYSNTFVAECNWSGVPAIGLFNTNIFPIKTLSWEFNKIPMEARVSLRPAREATFQIHPNIWAPPRIAEVHSRFTWGSLEIWKYFQIFPNILKPAPCAKATFIKSSKAVFKIFPNIWPPQQGAYPGMMDMKRANAQTQKQTPPES